MRRGGTVYKIAKKAEHPNDNLFWNIVHKVYELMSIVIGEKEYNIIREQYKDETIIFTCSVSNGDYYLMSLYLEECLKCCNIEKYIVLVPSPLEKMCTSLKIPNILPCSFMQQMVICKYLAFVRYQNCNSLNFTPWLFFDKRSDFNRLPHMSVHQSERNEQIVKEKGLTPGKTVVLSPYEKSVSVRGKKQLQLLFWENLASELKKRGYDVCTNCSGSPQEPAILGTKQVFPSFSEIHNFCEVCGLVIAVRSGFVDMCALSRCKKIILYPDTCFLESFSIASMFGTEINVEEIVYERFEDSIEDLTNEVLTRI